MSRLETQSRSLSKDVQVAVIGVLSVAVAVYLVASAASGWRSRVDIPILLSFLPSAVVAVLAILLEMRRRPYSLHLIHLVALVLLLVVAPLVQNIRGAFPSRVLVSDQDTLRANLCVFVWVVAYVLGESFFRRRFGPVRTPLPLLERNISFASLAVGTVAASISLAYLAYRGTAGAVTRAAMSAAYASESTMDSALAIVFRAAPSIVLAAWLLLLALFPKQRTWLNYGIAAVLLAGNLVLNNPMAAARYWTATIFLAVACVIYLRKTTTGTVLLPGAVLGVLLLPSLNLGRTETDFDVRMLTPSSMPGRSPLESGDYDAYVNIVMTNRLLDLDGITYGWQLLGPLLFWVPRSLWSSKPTGSGTYLAERMDMPWANIGTPLPAEALINFGFFGIAPFAVVFAGILYLADSRYYLNKLGAPPERFRPLDVVYPFWLGLVVFITRGDIMNGASFVVAVTFAGIVSLRFFNTRSTV